MLIPFIGFLVFIAQFATIGFIILLLDPYVPLSFRNLGISIVGSFLGIIALRMLYGPIGVSNLDWCLFIGTAAISGRLLTQAFIEKS